MKRMETVVLGMVIVCVVVFCLGAIFEAEVFASSIENSERNSEGTSVVAEDNNGVAADGKGKDTDAVIGGDPTIGNILLFLFVVVVFLASLVCIRWDSFVFFFQKKDKDRNEGEEDRGDEDEWTDEDKERREELREMEEELERMWKELDERRKRTKEGEARGEDEWTEEDRQEMEKLRAESREKWEDKEEEDE